MSQNFTSNTPGKAQSMPDNAQETLTKTQQMDPLWKKLMLLPYFAKADMEEKRQMYRKEQEREGEEVERHGWKKCVACSYTEHLGEIEDNLNMWLHCMVPNGKKTQLA
ncbi:hypothetical protein CAPTEDRAFT_203768 [Capitella teleta]|uniref:Uncharacterized protein n=1 Tax=Capitella teleta TaxID=283909 RepID=R7TC75_CAPTE|nr:hypothetical protein CAPTEDRAFT_203768 [Capitella teleta]|eukprot:ELT91122.1 hypothetical protein CAPTEDRAFT_203768 [Capitella teleta]